MTPRLYIQELAGKGRGVFSDTLIPSGTLIEICPLQVVPAEDSPLLAETALVDYFFHFDRDNNVLALALGFGSLYNHAVHPNAAYEIARDERCMRVYALSDIPAGTEICFNYSGEPGNPFKEWFEARGMEILH